MAYQEHVPATRRELGGVEVTSTERLGHLRVEPEGLARDAGRVPCTGLGACEAGIESNPQRPHRPAGGLGLSPALGRQLPGCVVRGAVLSLSVS